MAFRGIEQTSSIWGPVQDLSVGTLISQLMWAGCSPVHDQHTFLGWDGVGSKCTVPV